MRVNDRFQIEDVNLANRLWIETGLRELVCGGEDGVDGESGERMTEDERRELWYVLPCVMHSCDRVVVGGISKTWDRSLDLDKEREMKNEK